MPQSNQNLARVADESRMTFIETTRYQRFPTSNGASTHPVPPHWEQHEHPNGDIYYFHRELRLITPENMRDPDTLRFVLEAREDHLQCLGASVAHLPDDWELVLSDVTDSVAVIGMYSRRHRLAYEWSERRGAFIFFSINSFPESSLNKYVLLAGLQIKAPPEYFWSHVAEYPSHHAELPPNAESEFTQALSNARMAVTDGAVFPFSEAQIDQIIERYHHLKELQSQGRQVVPALGWLMGMVMPLDAVEKSCSDEELDDMMVRMRF